MTLYYLVREQQPKRYYCPHTSYYAEMDSFLVSFKKEAADARSQGNVDEKSADPITFSLFRMILNWAVEQGNLFVWVWTILQ